MELKKNLSKRAANLQGMLFASPPLITFALFGLVPLLVSLVLSFCSLDSYNIFDAKPVGFDNYIAILTEDTKFLKSIGNTFLYAFLTVAISIVLSLLLSVCLNVKIKGRKAIRTILFIPYVCSAVAISTMWKWIFDYNYGVLNDIVEWFGGTRVDWLHNESTAMGVIIAMSVWSGLGFNIILYSAAISSISNTYYEAAMIDGANKVQQFFYITLPSIKPISFYLIVMGFIGALQSFANFIIMTPTGGPGNSTLTMGLRLYMVAFGDEAILYGMGYASAMGWIVGLIVMVFVAIYFYINGRKEKN